MGRASDARERLMGAVAELFWTGSYDGTTIDQICEKAGVKKGSFYYFFDGKPALAAAALDSEWEKYRPTLDGIFSATKAPLVRLRDHCEFTIREQEDLKGRHGCVLGCPLCTLGTEISTQDKVLRGRVQEILNHGLRYVETAIRDADSRGEIRAPDPAAKARLLHAYQLGLMTQARIENSLEVLRDLIPMTFELLGAKVPVRRRRAVAA